ncbi:arylamine N-acetyltransferase [Streptomyces sp. NBC_01275]|uniref:arylamine N-acetyltransferase family protein n=1 Tax=Streptomyces sp. NBC_01275 TaxID=2903807 RepID=UPI00224E4788|nr:arylamine N-acetyltransferase [Streptomyces sp. NBC_01275]MCX4761564.1 arylamine N-acetyltransferase [Streptomyces sp. NBC_01275]
MFDVDTYLKHLGYTGTLAPTADNLRELHKRHMMTVPFDNSRNAAKGLAIWDDVDAGADVFFQALITEGRGGICHELSGLFRALLTELGYDVTVVSSGVRGAGDQFGPDLEHMLSLVRLDGEEWLVDVGFAGPSFTEPVRVSAQVQRQNGFDYRVVGDGDHLVLQRRPADGDWQAVYRFTLQERALSEWKAIASGENDDPYWHWAGEMIRAGTLIYGRVYDTGQLLLVGRRYLRAEDGKDQARVLAKTDEYESVVRHVLRQDA